MANIQGQKKWSDVRLLETHELARGGTNGNLNEQAIALADRTEFLMEEKASKSEIVQGVFEFGTYAEFNAAKANLPLNCTVVIGETNTGSGTWGAGNNRWNGSTLTKSLFDPLEQAKIFANANPLFKPVQVKAGDNPNNYLKPGIYYHWGAQIAAADLPNWPYYISGNACFGTLVVENPHPSAAESSGATQTFYPYLDNFSPYLRKKSQAGGSSWLPWSQYVTDLNKNNITTLTTEGADVLALPLGTYHWASLVFGNSLLNMPNCPYKYGRLEIRAGAAGHGGMYKLAVFYPYGRDKNFYINSNFESNTWTGWRTYKDSETLEAAIAAAYSSKSETASLISSAVNSVVESISGSEYFGKNYTDPEMKGNSFYASAYYAGYNQTTGSKGIVFNSIEALIYNPSGTEIEWRLYTGNKCAVGQYGNTVSAANALLPDASGFITDFPTIATEPVKIKLNKAISIPANTPFVLVFRNAGLTTLRIGCFYQSNPLNMPSRGFSMWAQPQEWGQFTIANASPGSGYYQTGFKLKFIMDSTGSNPNPTPIEEYKPTIVLPPRIFTLRGLESHVYPEHLLAENHNIYNHDIVCTKGRQMERGWLWNHNPDAPDAYGSYAFSWDMYNQQTGKALATASSTVIMVDDAAKSGVNLNVSVIGDSLVNAGAMTQRLLDLQATNTTKLNLIGTRGTGLNKHEGRGGWTINDYTGVGRTYYKFDVSGVTTIPAINSAIYKIGDTELLVQEVNISSGSGTIICSLNKGSAPTLNIAGTLTKDNGSAGDATIAYSNCESVSGNPFWNAATNQVDYAGYLQKYNLAVPDIVFIQLGVNDTFGLTSDDAVVAFSSSAFTKLDTLIASIKVANPNVKIAVMTPPTYANQDAFGYNYSSNQTAWRAKRNIVIYNNELIKRFKNKEANSIYVLGSGINVDTINNFPISSAELPVNSHNSLVTYKPMVNGVHPAASGYFQIGDVMFCFIKWV
ncbi:hypothetical protein KMZ14_04950 [Acinetobacter schindleri]|uniref:hypothetical protein n=1 Tax=Acinetobacter schindleri TaxID=108981 RepID=UPI0023621B16|nr:hypothetical protein [Acinetobacter schindleri]WDE16898.1 hypothetical protein KMZ14_04950 [Acinetobacter schindleri]